MTFEQSVSNLEARMCYYALLINKMYFKTMKKKMVFNSLKIYVAQNTAECCKVPFIGQGPYIVNKSCNKIFKLYVAQRSRKGEY